MKEHERNEMREAEAIAIADQDGKAMTAFLRSLDLSDANLAMAASLAPQIAQQLGMICLKMAQGDTCVQRWHVATSITAAILKDSKYPAFVDACPCDDCQKARKGMASARI